MLTLSDDAYRFSGIPISSIFRFYVYKGCEGRGALFSIFLSAEESLTQYSFILSKYMKYDPSSENKHLETERKEPTKNLSFLEALQDYADTDNTKTFMGSSIKMKV